MSNLLVILGRGVAVIVVLVVVVVVVTDLLLVSGPLIQNQLSWMNQTR